MNITQEHANELAKSMFSLIFKKFKSELDGENEEFAGRTLRAHLSRVASISNLAAQKWCKFDNEGPVLTPDNTRIYYRKGKQEILLQEFAPQVRLLKFRGALAKRNNSMAQLEEDTKNKVFNYSLALPYTIFIFRFTDGLFQDVRCAFSDRPLKKLDEKPLKPYFSNIDSNLVVCLGSFFEKDKLVKGDIFQQSAFVLSHFWQSVFSDEWSAHFWEHTAHFQNSDPRLANLQNWQEASSENSLFVVEDVNWLKHAEESFGDMIAKILEGVKVGDNFEENLYKQVAEEVLTDINNTFKESVDAISERITPAMISQVSEEITKYFENKEGD